MDFANEEYRRLYVRDTITWKRLGWTGQNVLTQILRKMDRSGVLELGGMEPAEAVALVTGGPIEEIETGLGRLLQLEVLQHVGDSLVWPRFVEAQTVNKSDKQRQRESRDRRRANSLGQPPPVTKRDAESQNVTESHARSHAVTGGHTPSHAVTLNSADLSSAQRSGAFYAPSAPVVSTPVRVGMEWYAALLQKDVLSIPAASGEAASAYDFIGKQSAEDRETVAKNLRDSSIHGKKLRSLSPRRIAGGLWHTHLLSEADHAAQKAQYGKQPPAAAAPVPAAHQLMKF